MVRGLQGVMDEVGPDEAGSAGDEESAHVLTVEVSFSGVSGTGYLTSTCHQQLLDRTARTGAAC
ncbi:hypothetical protein ACFFX0_10115 [Citricoccus parietis]|uniref:Uncharacterized protein n=1 Tax=Citricoccus parietis TaxID=592307 RepID=A0ABV5FYP4_9MICC